MSEFTDPEGCRGSITQQTLSSEHRLVGCLCFVSLSGCPQAELGAELSNWRDGKALGSDPPQAAAPDGAQTVTKETSLAPLSSRLTVLNLRWVSG